MPEPTEPSTESTTGTQTPPREPLDLPGWTNQLPRRWQVRADWDDRMSTSPERWGGHGALDLELTHSGEDVRVAPTFDGWHADGDRLGSLQDLHRAEFLVSREGVFQRLTGESEGSAVGRWWNAMMALATLREASGFEEHVATDSTGANAVLHRRRTVTVDDPCEIPGRGPCEVIEERAWFEGSDSTLRAPSQVLEYLHADLHARGPTFRSPAQPGGADAVSTWTMVTGVVLDPDSRRVLTFWNEYIVQDASYRTFEVRVHYVPAE
ncbi:MAG: hypothetical protein AAGF12_01225 [Myxococcota bacterium]